MLCKKRSKRRGSRKGHLRRGKSRRRNDDDDDDDDDVIMTCVGNSCVDVMDDQKKTKQTTLQTKRMNTNDVKKKHMQQKQKYEPKIHKTI